jgi:hypothetical protein
MTVIRRVRRRTVANCGGGRCALYMLEASDDNSFVNNYQSSMSIDS